MNDFNALWREKASRRGFKWSRSILLSAVLIISGFFVPNAQAAITSIMLTAPNGGEIWHGTQTINWNATTDEEGGTISILLSTNSGDNYSEVIAPSVNVILGQYQWDTTQTQAGSLIDGSTYRVKITDGATGIDYSSSDFIVDNTNPTSSAGGLSTYQTVSKFNISYTANDNLSGVDYVELYYNKDNTGWMKYGDNFTSSSILFDSSITGRDGSYEFYTIAVDKAGNREISESADSSTIVDTQNPTVEITYNPISPVKAGAMTITATYSEPIVGTPQVSINQSGTTDVDPVDMTVTNGTDNKVWTYAYTVNTATGDTYIDGEATVSLSTVVDTASNSADAPTNTTFTIDTTPPTSSITSPIANAVVKNISGEVSLVFDATGGSVCQYKVDSGNYQTLTSCVSPQIITLADGRKSVVLKVTDAAGNPAESTAVSFVVDKDNTLDVPRDFTTIQTAIDNATAGDTIEVTAAAEAYNENLVVDVEGLKLKSNGEAANTTINAADPSKYVVEITADGATLDGFTITGMANDTENMAAVILQGVDSCTITNNILTGNHKCAINLFSVGTAYSDSNTVSNNVITGPAGIDTRGIKIKGSHNTISENEVYNTDNPILIWGYDDSETASPNYNTISDNVIRPGDDTASHKWGVKIKTGHYNKVTDNTITDATESAIYLYTDRRNAPETNFDPRPASDTISGNIITGGKVGIALLDGANNNTISGNTISGTTLAGILGALSQWPSDWSCKTLAHTGETDYQVYLQIVSNTIEDNNITDCGHGITMEYSDGNTLTGNTIKNNAGDATIVWEEISFTANGRGVYFDANSEGNVINYNNISGNTGYGLESGVAVDAADNWWDSTNGPEHSSNTFNVGVQGDAVSDNVDFVPWLDATFPGGASFAPVTTTDPADGKFSSIQAAVNNSNASAIINVAAGMYDERIVINKPLTLKGATNGITKKGFIVPENYNFDQSSQSIIKPSSDVDQAVVQIKSDGVTFDGFVVSNLTAGIDGTNLRDLVQIYYGFDANIAGIEVSNNILGPNTDNDSAVLAKNRSGLTVVGPRTNPLKLIVKGNKIFDNKEDGCGIMIVASYSAVYHNGGTGFTDMFGTVIENNEITGNHRTGIELAGGVWGTAENYIQIKNNLITNNGWRDVSEKDNLKFGHGVMMIRGASDKPNADASGSRYISFTGNIISGNEKSGFYIAPNNKYIEATDNTIQNNGVGTNSYSLWDGIRVDLDEMYYGGTAAVDYGVFSNVSFLKNKIVGNGGLGINVMQEPTTGPVAATNNYWGAVSGPYHSPENTLGVGNAVSDYVDYSPWCLDDTYLDLGSSDPLDYFDIDPSAVSSVVDIPITLTVTAKDAADITRVNDVSVVSMAADSGASLGTLLLTLVSGVGDTTVTNSITGTVNVSGIEVGGTAIGSTSVSFTSSDPDAPTVLSQTPTGGLTDVAINISPTITFSEAMDANTVNNSTLKLRISSDDSVISSVVSLNDDRTVATIDPISNLLNSTQYYIWVSGAKDLAGNTVEDYTNEANQVFTTGAESVTLAVTGISLTQSLATDDDTFENGWHWTFYVTVPTVESSLLMQFSDWSGSAGVIPVANNTRFYSAQSDHSTTNPVVIMTANTYTGPILLIDDLDLATPGRQIQVTVETKVPVGSAGGSYSASYGVKSE